MAPTAGEAITRELVALADDDCDRVAGTARYLQMEPGGYGEGDQLLGVRVPAVRQVVRAHRRLATPRDVVSLWSSEWHEVRLAGCVLACELARRGDTTMRTTLAQSLLEHTDRVDNWDLVDTVAPVVLGEWLIDRPDRGVLDALAASPSLWERRLAVVATLSLIRAGQFAEILRLSEALLADPHHLVHKAVGWMLREVGLRNRAVFNGFLDQHAGEMPRIMLRYALEKHEPAERARYLGRPFHAAVVVKDARGSGGVS